jgi:hypothetical protein
MIKNVKGYRGSFIHVYMYKINLDLSINNDVFYKNIFHAISSWLAIYLKKKITKFPLEIVRWKIETDFMHARKCLVHTFPLLAPPCSFFPEPRARVK